MSTPTIKSSTEPIGSQAPDRAQGLVSSHISDRAPDFSPSLSVFANLVKVHIPSQARIGGGMRGAIRGFTPQARKRFLESIAKARDIQGGTIATLTYPAEFPTDPEIYHRDLAALLKRLARWEPNARGWWRLEFQQRGAPHFHLLIFGARRNTKQLRRWMKAAWYQVVGSGNVYHFQAGTQVDIIRNRRHAMYYAAKYSAKLDQSKPNAEGIEPDQVIGRTWGTFGTINSHPALVVELAPWQVQEVKRSLVRWLHSRMSRFERRLARSPASQGYTVFGAGDQSNDAWQLPSQSTVFRMIEPFLSG